MKTSVLLNFAAFLIIAIQPVTLWATPFLLPPYVDEQGNVHFIKPINSSSSRVADELAIKRLEADYQAAIDDSADENGMITDRLDDWVNLWTENGNYISDLVSVVASFGAIPPEVIEADGKSVQGHANLRIVLEALENAGVNGKRHLLSSVRVQFISSTLAIGQSEFAVLEADIVPPVVVATGRYNTVYEKIKGRWLFRQRKQDADAAWGPISGVPVNSMQDIVNDLEARVRDLEAIIHAQ